MITKVKTGFLFGLLIVFFSACNSGENKLSDSELAEFKKQEILAKEKQLLSENANLQNKPLAEELVKSYQNFVDSFPQDSLCDDFLFKAADISRGLGRSLNSVDIYVKLIKKYPNSPKAPLALFLQAFVFDNELNDDKKAASLYQSFIEKYPDHQLRKDAEFSMLNLGKSDEELIEEFEKKASKNKS